MVRDSSLAFSGSLIQNHCNYRRKIGSELYKSTHTRQAVKNVRRAFAHEDNSGSNNGSHQNVFDVI